MSSRIVCVTLVLGLVSACSTPGDSEGNQSAAQTGQNADLAPTPTASDVTCTATFHWWQKDAYASRAGRTSDLWPPHTTTTIDATCTDGETFSAYRENHGTLPGAVDADGNVILVDVKDSDPVTVPLASLQAMLATYAACECAPTTAFLSLDAVGDAQAAQLLGALASYVEQNMTCGGASPDQLVAALQSGDIDDALAMLSTCAWNDGEDWGTGFTSATQAVLGNDYASYHVCNNDAQLESTMWDQFASGGTVQACDSNSAVCHGPVFFYNP
jgi:hypothetical protein